ncbi:hypothetical protein SAY87_015864 [Trapa incisa]|uniref:C2H2-type domain-containing protein n=1 Tax=Trapa incisa TaxID=236973 RepID=A0AAN7L0C1_9MYRT|nr:hypothetical protein SAY87_015864 [Trapa incisa]
MPCASGRRGETLGASPVRLRHHLRRTFFLLHNINIRSLPASHQTFIHFSDIATQITHRFSISDHKLILPMKRERSGEDLVDVEVIEDSVNDTAACALVLLSRVGGSDNSKVAADALREVGGGGGGRVFTCKMCNRKFSSFQALGGHRASHMKLRLMAEATPAKPKTHECAICGLEFPIGQALGGHMRRHRGEISAAAAPPHVPMLKKSTSRKRVTLCLDLNLSPLENDLRMILQGKVAQPFSLVA